LIKPFDKTWVMARQGNEHLPSAIRFPPSNVKKHRAGAGMRHANCQPLRVAYRFNQNMLSNHKYSRTTVQQYYRQFRAGM
jgi:hypothetical protein